MRHWRLILTGILGALLGVAYAFSQMASSQEPTPVPAAPASAVREWDVSTATGRVRSYVPDERIVLETEGGGERTFNLDAGARVTGKIVEGDTVTVSWHRTTSAPYRVTSIAPGVSDRAGGNMPQPSPTASGSEAVQDIPLRTPVRSGDVAGTPATTPTPRLTPRVTPRPTP